MKKLILAISLSIISFQALAETPQIELVERIYREARQNQDSTAVLSRYADASFKAALRKANRAEMCLDFDPIWNSQDPDTRARVTFNQTGNQVKASFSQGGSRTHVTYQLSCRGGSCQISDIKHNGNSFKRYIVRDC